VQLTGTGPPTLSVAVGSVYVTIAPAVDVAAATFVPGTFVNTGLVVSCTVTVNDADASMPRLLVAVQVTVVVVIANVEPEAGVHTGSSGPSVGSVAVATNVTAAPPGLVASTVMSPGTVTVGANVGSGANTANGEK